MADLWGKDEPYWIFPAAGDGFGIIHFYESGGVDFLPEGGTLVSLTSMAILMEVVGMTSLVGAMTSLAMRTMGTPTILDIMVAISIANIFNSIPLRWGVGLLGYILGPRVEDRTDPARLFTTFNFKTWGPCFKYNLIIILALYLYWSKKIRPSKAFVIAEAGLGGVFSLDLYSTLFPLGSMWTGGTAYIFDSLIPSPLSLFEYVDDRTDNEETDDWYTFVYYPSIFRDRRYIKMGVPKTFKDLFIRKTDFSKIKPLYYKDYEDDLIEYSKDPEEIYSYVEAIFNIIKEIDTLYQTYCRSIGHIASFSWTIRLEDIFGEYRNDGLRDPLVDDEVKKLYRTPLIDLFMDTLDEEINGPHPRSFEETKALEIVKEKISEFVMDLTSKKSQIIRELSDKMGPKVLDIEIQNQGSSLGGFKPNYPFFFALGEFANFTEISTVRGLLEFTDIIMDTQVIVSRLARPPRAQWIPSEFFLTYIKLKGLGSIFQGIYHRMYVYSTYLFRLLTGG